MSNEKATYEIRLKDSFSQGFSKIDRNVDGFENKINNVNGRKGGSKGMGGLANMAGLAARSFALLGGTMAAVGLGKKIVSLGVNMEQTRVSFETFLGSAEKGNAVIAQLNEFSNVTPFDNESVLRAGKSLLAFGTASNELIPSLRAIGDISAGTGKNFNELVTIYGKARVAGTIYAEDINQLVEAGVPIMGEFAKALGTTEDQVKKLASQGKLKFKDLETGFTNLTSEGGMFFDLMKKQSQTVGGLYSTLVGKLQLMGATMGEKTLPVLSKILKSVINLVDQIPNLDFSPFTDSVRDTWNALQDLGTVFSDLFSAFGLNSESIFTLQNAIDVLSISMRIGMTPLRIMIMGLTTMGEVASDVASIFQGLGLSIYGALSKNPTLVAAGVQKIANSGLQAFDKVSSRLQGFASEEADFYGKLFKEREKKEPDAVTGAGGAAGRSMGIGGANGSSTSREQVASSISGSGPKNVVLNVDKLVESINFNNQSVKESSSNMVEQVKQALLTALNDAVIATR